MIEIGHLEQSQWKNFPILSNSCLTRNGSWWEIKIIQNLLLPWHHLGVDIAVRDLSSFLDLLPRPHCHTEPFLMIIIMIIAKPISPPLYFQKCEQCWRDNGGWECSLVGKVHSHCAPQSTPHQPGNYLTWQNVTFGSFFSPLSLSQSHWQGGCRGLCQCLRQKIASVP